MKVRIHEHCTGCSWAGQLFRLEYLKDAISFNFSNKTQTMNSHFGPWDCSEATIHPPYQLPYRRASGGVFPKKDPRHSGGGAFINATGVNRTVFTIFLSAQKNHRIQLHIKKQFWSKKEKSGKLEIT